MTRRCFLIVNPTSGSYSQRTVDQIMAGLRERGLAPELMPTGSAADPALFAARLCAQHSDPLVIVAGGDGTVNGVLNGLVPGRATLGVVPLGTANVLARELGISSVADALDRLARGTTRPISVGEIERDGEKRRFLLMAGAGMDGAVVRGVRLSEKRVIGKGAYLLSALRVLLSWDRSELRVTGGGRSLSCHGVIVCNAAKYGGNFVLAPEADLFSPGFQVLCIEGGRLAYLKLGLMLLSGRGAPPSCVTSFAATELELSGDKAVQLDGDYFCCTPLHIRTLPELVRLVV
ncbi:sphingosine/diacylglycerol kinase-related protein [Citrifermentans bemidjiense Bem]|uniref:Sphingosine/diacylglycerol kinase-related protein n=1 Tax=Citrifermentans bemidjiense (strain ATCC BAA-1014 / DSM 16622 / JCM 12645 / Bem) TaxID=404380 RepID=B5EDZ7_CITBB|nr:YegS/Rv2252/BmrU family lipid kinase [Citrifermentans bemidjiense]ACH37735.1 sphingosine/diacylglycerol kinase-related protein [Citrifermentans bemidjiense Bem]